MLRRRTAFALACVTTTAAGLLTLLAPTSAAGGIPSPPPTSSPGVAPSNIVQAPIGLATAGPLLAQAQSTYQTMTQTRYQNTNYVIRPSAGVYFWDCVGFVDWALRQATPNAESAMRTALGIRTGFVPTPTQLASYISGSPSSAWQQVASVNELVGGEVMVIPGNFTNGGKTYSGHATVVAGAPLALSDGSYAIFVYDSTALPGHGRYDSRLTDSRALPLVGSTTRFSGTGYGTMRITVGPGGAPLSAYWSAGSASPTGTSVVFGRPLN